MKFNRIRESTIWETIKVVIISLAIVIPIRYFLVQPFFVRGASMVPNFDNGQYLIIDEISYRFEEPRRGDVVVFKYPLNPGQHYIKRIIGLPGETVEIKNGSVIIYSPDSASGRVLDESVYLPDSVVTLSDMRVRLSESEYFVLGDNRMASSDSRQWGALEQGYIVGRVWVRAWPWSAAKIF